MKNLIRLLVMFLMALLLTGCAEIAKRDMKDHSAKEEPIYLASCASAYPIAIDPTQLTEFAEYGGSMLSLNNPTLDQIAQSALAKAGCGTTRAAWYRVSTSFDITGKMLGSMCGAQVGGYYALFTGSYGGRCVNFNAAKLTLTVFDMRAKKDLFEVTVETAANEEDEIEGGRFLKGIRESSGSDGGFSKTPEGRIIAGLMYRGLGSLIDKLGKKGLPTIEKSKNAR